MGTPTPILQITGNQFASPDKGWGYSRSGVSAKADNSRDPTPRKLEGFQLLTILIFTPVFSFS